MPACRRSASRPPDVERALADSDLRFVRETTARAEIIVEVAAARRARPAARPDSDRADQLSGPAPTRLGGARRIANGASLG